MRLTLPSSRLLSLALAAGLLAASGCAWENCEIFGQSVSVDGQGVMSVDNTQLPFDRWVDVSADLAGVARVELATGTDLVRVSGAPGTAATLRVHLYSEIEGDGAGVFENGRLVARSQGGGKVFINAIEGTIPAGLPLLAQSGTGSLDVSALSGDARVELKSGTGDIALRSSSVGAVLVEDGTGAATLDGVVATSFQLDTGTGAISLTSCRAPKAAINTGTGDCTLTGCELAELDIKSGTGDLLLDGGKLDKVEFQSGTGDLTQRGGVTIGSLRQS